MSGFEAVNLINNLSVRSSGDSYKPYDSTGTQVTYESCFITTENELGANGHQLMLGVDFGKSFLMHAILMVQDVYGGRNADDHTIDGATKTTNPVGIENEFF